MRNWLRKTRKTDRTAPAATPLTVREQVEVTRRSARDATINQMTYTDTPTRVLLNRYLEAVGA